MSLLSNIVAQGPGTEFMALGVFMMLFFVGIFVVAILLAIWVYRDAEERDMNGVLWLLVVLLTNIIGLIIYLVVRADHPKGGTKPARQGQPQGPFCPSCGDRLTEGDRFCSNCGHDVTGEPAP